MKTVLNNFISTSPEAKNRPVIAFIPGGPGLSSKTLSGLEILYKHFDLVFLDPPGTGGQLEPFRQEPSMVFLSMENALKTLNRPIILVGHSFGGYQAATLVERNNLDITGLVCMATPISSRAFNGLAKEYEKNMTSQLKKSEDLWSNNQSLESMQEWFLNYGLLFFSETSLNKGKELLANDKMSLSSFLGLRDHLENQDTLLKNLKNKDIPKLMLAGELDKLLPANLLKTEAEEGHFEFVMVKNAAHFMNLDQPEIVAGLIENKFLATKRR